MKLKKNVSDKNCLAIIKHTQAFISKGEEAFSLNDPLDCNIQSGNLMGNDFTGTQTYLHWHTPLPGTKSSLSLLPRRA